MKTTEPLITIVTISYNQASYIESTIKSVLNQSYSNIEYIVVDGGSTDGTIEILKRYEDRLKWISEKDRGPEDAVNKGFRMAHGDLLAWIASDDEYLPGTFDTVANYFVQHPDVDMVYGRASYIDPAGTVLFEYPTEKFDDKALAVYNIICQPSVFFTRRAFFDAGELALDLNIASDMISGLESRSFMPFGIFHSYFLIIVCMMTEGHLHLPTSWYGIESVWTLPINITDGLLQTGYIHIAFIC
jgi:glycosyltransferase involved in cell wall biosynthesis